MHKKIISYPNPSLNKESRPVVLQSESDLKKLDDLVDTFRVIQGYGLAAPQIGHHLRAFVINPIALGIEGCDDEYIEVINPEIECSGEDYISEEACFSVPEVSSRVKRSENCQLKFFDRTGKHHTIAAVGHPAACIQHEYDHLDGKLFLYRISSLKRSILTRKISKIRKKREYAAKLARMQFDEDSMLYMDAPPVEKKKPVLRKKKKRIKRQKRKKK